MSVNRKISLSILLIVILVSLISASGIFYEVIPVKEVLYSVLEENIKNCNDGEFEASFIPDYPGKYSVFLVLKHGNGDKEVEFFIEGSYRVKGEDGVVLQSREFKKKISNRNSGVTLSEFEIDREQVVTSKVFGITFSNGCKHMRRYFDEITLHVKKDLKFSVFD